MINNTWLTEHIMHIRIPFEDNYTSAFIVITDHGTAVLDAGNSAQDAHTYILPVLKEYGLTPALLFASHSHCDHAGGLPALSQAYPTAKIAGFHEQLLQQYDAAIRHPLTDGERLLDILQVLHLPGHAPDAAGVLDTRTQTILTFDCFQGFGVSRYGTGVVDVASYRRSIRRVRDMQIYRLIAAHEFVPCGLIAEGYDNVTSYLDCCEASLDVVLGFVSRHTALTPEELAARYRLAVGQALPPIAPGHMSAMLEACRRDSGA